MPNLFASIFVNSRATSPVSLLLPEMPPWLEAGLFGMLLGIYFGLWCAFLYRTRARRAVSLARSRWASAWMQSNSRRPTKQPITATVTVPGRDVAYDQSTAIDEQIESLAAALGDDVTAEWRSELHRHQDRLIRLHQALE